MGKLSNILTMIELLNTGKKYSIDELSVILEVSPRMIRVYKEDLEKAGIYVDTIRGPYGGYVLRQSIKMPVRKFNNDDIVLLNDLSFSIVNNEELFNRLNIFKDKVNGIYKGNIEELVLSDENITKYNLFARAIKEKRKVRILYYSVNKGENERIIHPYNLFLYNNGWGVASFCESRSDLRHFELKRIIKCELLDDMYE